MKQNKTVNASRIIGHVASGIAAFLGIALFLFIFAALILCIHPGISQNTAVSSGFIGNIVSPLENAVANMKGDVLNSYLSEADVIKKVYTIPEDATAAPAPSPDGYGTVSYDEPEKVLEVIEQARKYKLLAEDEQVVFSADADFYKNGNIEYYLDETIMVICWKEWINSCAVCCSEIKIADGSQFRRKVTGDTYGSGTQTYCSSMAKQTNSVIAFNADFYAFRNLGITCYNRTVYRFGESGYGSAKAYNAVDTLFIDESGDFHYFERGQSSTKEEVQQWVNDNNILFSIAFGPILIKDGELYNTSYTYPVGEYYKEYSRAGIGQVCERHYLYMNVQIVPNHLEIPRATLKDFAEIMYSKNLRQAYNLDGGQTGEIYINGHVFNHIDWGNERLVSDIIYFGTALPEEEQ